MERHADEREDFQVHVDANEFTRCIHNRMPVLLGRYDYNTWQTGKGRCGRHQIPSWPISKRVNVSGRGNDDPSQIERYKPKPGFLARERSVTLKELRARREIDMNEECPKELGDGARQ
jgi:hypothetical protein